MEMQVETLDGGVVKITLVGRLDIVGAEKIDLQFSAIAASQRKVIVDLAQVPFLASMGIRTLIIGARSMKSKGARMMLLDPQPDVEKVLVSTGTETFIPIVHGLGKAIEALSQ